jgi:hypothetical protein
VTDEDVWGRAAALINELHRHTTNLNAASVKAKLAQIMERRNQIAHHADLEAGQLKRRHPIDAPAATDAVDWIERIALAIAAVLS